MTTTTIAILKDGTPVRIHLFDNSIFDVDGFLIQFTRPGVTPEVYRYHQQAEFKREDRKKPNLSGYYNEDLFLKYIQNVEPLTTIDKLIKYDFKRDLATENEEITVSTVDFDEPYDYFYNEKKYTFNLQRTLDNKGVRNYLKPIIENFKTVDIKINTDGVNGVTILNNQSGTPGGYFYKKNLGDFINTWTITDIQKSNFKKVMALIVFKIREINKYIIPIIAANTHFFDKEIDVANGIIDYNDTTTGDRLTDLEKLLFDLKRGWGYYYNPLNPEDFPLREDFDAQFTQLSSYKDYQDYYSSLENFYNKCYITKDLKNYPSDEKLQYLLEILTPSGLSLLPYNLILKTIKSYLVGKLSEESQRLLVKLIISITPAHANDFLDFLLEKQNGDQTNFETIYEALTDGRLERYSYVNWFVNEQTNKKYFAFAVFELWKVSKYNLAYIAPGVTPTYTFTNFSGVDPTNYFVINPTEYNNNNFLEFSSKDIGIHKIDVSFESSIEGKKIKIDKLIRDEHEVDIRKTHDDKTVFFGAFHLYQQISFSGFEANLDLSIPKKATVPAFLFHFIEEFDRIADFDAAASLVIDLTTDVLLTYFLGGASFIADLHYLKYTTKIGRALIGSLEASETVVVWRGLEVGSEAFTLTAGSLTHINTYLISTENDEDKRKILEGYRKVLIPLIFLGAGASLTARAHATREAGRVLDLIDALPSGVAHGLSFDMIDLLTTLKGSKTVTLTTFGNRLNTLDLGGATNTIFSKYNTLFTDTQKLKFWNDFQHIDDPAFWKLLNSGKGVDNVLNAKYIDNWISLTEKGLPEAKFTEYICVQKRTDALIRFTDQSNIKPVIGSLSYERKLVFLETFGDIDPTNFAKFVGEPQLITYWRRYYDDLILRPNFVSLSNTKKIKWLEKYGDLSPDLYSTYLKANPDTILSWSKYSDESDLLFELNKYTDEEQILFYSAFKHNDLVSFNNFKLDPSLLVIQRNYLKAYVKIKGAGYPFSTTLSEVISVYGTQGQKLYIKLNEEFLITKNSGLTDNQLKDIVLKSGFSHEDFPDMIIFRDNISKKQMENFMRNPKDEFGNSLNEIWARDPDLPNNMLFMEKIKAVYKEFEPVYNEIHPWLEKRINFHLEQRIANKWKIDYDSMGYTGHIPGTHAEVRALNELLWKLEANSVIINDDIVTKLLGYNKNYQWDTLMPRCGDCLFISKEIRMIMSN